MENSGESRYILKEFYHDDPDGVIGNEDCGQMSPGIFLQHSVFIRFSLHPAIIYLVVLCLIKHLSICPVERNLRLKQ